MLKVDPKQMQRIKACIGKPWKAQEKVFAELNYSPYVDPIDTSNDHIDEETQAIDILNYNDIKDDIKRNADDHDIFTKDRCAEIMKGSMLSVEEEQLLHEYIFEADYADYFINTFTVSDQIDWVYCVIDLRSEGHWINVGFYGFYTSEEEAVTKVKRMVVLRE